MEFFFVVDNLIVTMREGGFEPQKFPLERPGGINRAIRLLAG